MFNYEVVSVVTGNGDSCLKVQVEDFEVSVAFELGHDEYRSPSDIRIYDNRGGTHVDVTMPVLGTHHVRVSSFADIVYAIALVERRFYNK